MQNVLIGALIALVGTVLVQVLIIPSVQRRTRKRERWERDITQLQTLLETEYPRNLRTLRRATPLFLAYHGFPERYRDEAMTQLPYKIAAADAVAAYDALCDTAIQALWLARRAAVYRPGRDPYWSGLLTDIAKLNASVADLDPRRFTENVGTAMGKFDRLLDEAHTEQGLIYVVLAEAADPLEPPRARPLRKVRGWLSGHRRQIAERLHRRKSATANPPEASPDHG